MRKNFKKTVLVVDDVELNRKVLSVILADQYRVVEADSGLDALAKLRREGDNVALILLDIVMPVMDGFTFLERIRTLGLYKDIPVILITAEAYEENILQGIKMGVRDVIAKPFNPEIVVKRVDNLIRLAEKIACEKSTEIPPAKSEHVQTARNTALIVDDVGINRVILRAALEKNYVIMEASDGAEALELLRAHNEEIAVVLLDIIMPIMDGLEMMQAANREELLGGIPVIAITSEDSPPKLSKILDLGVCEIIQKPFTPSVVKNRTDYIVQLAQ